MGEANKPILHVNIRYDLTNNTIPYSHKQNPIDHNRTYYRWTHKKTLYNSKGEEQFKHYYTNYFLEFSYINSRIFLVILFYYYQFYHVQMLWMEYSSIKILTQYYLYLFLVILLKIFIQLVARIIALLFNIFIILQLASTCLIVMRNLFLDLLMNYNGYYRKILWY